MAALPLIIIVIIAFIRVFLYVLYPLFGMHVNSVLVRSIHKRLRITSASCFPAGLLTFTSAGQTCPLHFTVACLYNDFSYKHLILSIANREACAPENEEMRKNVKLMPST